MWLSGDKCALVCFEPSKEAEHQRWVEENATTMYLFDTSRDQTELKWDVYQKIQDELKLGRPRQPNHARERDVVSGRQEDGCAPGTGGIKHKLAGITTIVQTMALISVTQWLMVSPVEALPLSGNRGEPVEVLPVDGDDSGLKRGRKRPIYSEEWVDTKLDIELERVFAFSRAAGFGCRSGPGQYPL